MIEIAWLKLHGWIVGYRIASYNWNYTIDGYIISWQITSILPKLMQSKERLGLHTLYIKLQVILIVVPELWMSSSEWAEDWFMFLS